MAKTKVHGEFLKDSVVRFTAKAGENITKGQAVYISGISGEVPVVSLADANDTAKMPAFGLAEATVSTNAEVEITSFGTLKGLDTSSYSLGDILYVDTTAGALTNNPSGLEATKLQNIGMVQRVHASSGSIKVGGAGRTNAVPNLDDGDIFIGDSNNKAISSPLSTEIESYLDGGTSTPILTSLTVNGATTITKTGTNASPHIKLTESGDTREFNIYNDGSGNGRLVLADTDDTPDTEIVLADNGILQFKTANSLAMTIDSSQNVGIGTSSPNGLISISSGAGTKATIETTRNFTVNRNFQIAVDEYAEGTFTITPSTTLGGSSYTTPIITATAAGRVGIGTSSPAQKLHVSGNVYVGAGNYFTDSTSGYFFGGNGSFTNGVYGVGTNNMAFNVNGSERMRIDSSGNLLVGKTYTAASVAGQELRAGGYTALTRSGGNPLEVNRLSSDGVIINLSKDNTTVGSIGATTGVLTIGNNNSGGIIFGYSGSHTFIEPSNTSGASVDDGATLGSSSKRFRDLYLSGNINGISAAKSASGNRWGILPEVESNGVMEIGRYLDFHATDGDTSDYTARLDANGSQLVSTAAMNLQGGLYLGGSGSANYLDDYEEGTFTATVGNSTNMSSLSFVSARYVKVGKLVHFEFEVAGGFSSSGTESSFSITLPFLTATTSTVATGMFSFFKTAYSQDRFSNGQIFQGTTQNGAIYVYIGGSQLPWAGNFGSGKGTFTYQSQ